MTELEKLRKEKRWDLLAEELGCMSYNARLDTYEELAQQLLA